MIKYLTVFLEITHINALYEDLLEMDFCRGSLIIQYAEMQLNHYL